MGLDWQLERIAYLLLFFGRFELKGEKKKKKKGGFQIFSCSVLRDKTVSTHAART